MNQNAVLGIGALLGVGVLGYFLMKNRHKGDLNNDGVVDEADLQLLMHLIGGTMSASTIAYFYDMTEEEVLKRADVNGDGEINAFDITALERLMQK